MQVAEKAYNNYLQQGLSADTTNAEYMACLPSAEVLLATPFAAENCSLTGPRVSSLGQADSVAGTVDLIEGEEPTVGEGGSEGLSNQIAAFVGGLGGALRMHVA